MKMLINKGISANQSPGRL